MICGQRSRITRQKSFVWKGSPRRQVGLLWWAKWYIFFQPLGQNFGLWPWFLILPLLGELLSWTKPWIAPHLPRTRMCCSEKAEHFGREQTNNPTTCQNKTQCTHKNTTTPTPTPETPGWCPGCKLTWSVCRLTQIFSLAGLDRNAIVWHFCIYRLFCGLVFPVFRYFDNSAPCEKVVQLKACFNAWRCQRHNGHRHCLLKLDQQRLGKPKVQLRKPDKTVKQPIPTSRCIPIANFNITNKHQKKVLIKLEFQNIDWTSASTWR